MTTELWPIGTRLARTCNGHAYRVCHQTRHETHLQPYREGDWGIGLHSKDGFVELPPLPDESALAKQGYRLTGMAADCSQYSRGRQYVNLDGNVSPENPRTSLAKTMPHDVYGCWRWLVERIEEEESKDAVSDEYDRGFTDGMREGRRAARDEAIRILAAKGEHDYE